MSKKIFTLFCAAFLTASLAGCAKSVSNSQSASTVKDGTTLVGQVQKIDGSSLTLALGTLDTPGGNPGNGSQQENAGTAAPAAPSGNSGGQTKPDSAQNDEPKGGAAPSGQPQGGQPPSGQPQGQGGQGGPAGNGHGSGFFTASGETKTVTVPSGAAVTFNKMGKQTSGTVSDIAIGDLVTVTMSGGTVTAISVDPAGGGQGGQGANPGATPSGSSPAASAAKAS